MRSAKVRIKKQRTDRGPGGEGGDKVEDLREVAASTC